MTSPDGDIEATKMKSRAALLWCVLALGFGKGCLDLIFICTTSFINFG